jgi:centrosomal protein CEP164
MEEQIDENYVPSQDEVMEYAQYLGMDLNEDQDLFYIAKEGLKAPLPDPWKPCKAPDGDIYYFNFESGESIWEHPCDEYYRKLYLQEKQSKRTKIEKKKIV